MTTPQYRSHDLTGELDTDLQQVSTIEHLCNLLVYYRAHKTSCSLHLTSTPHKDHVALVQLCFFGVASYETNPSHPRWYRIIQSRHSVDDMAACAPKYFPWIVDPSKMPRDVGQQVRLNTWLITGLARLHSHLHTLKEQIDNGTVTPAQFIGSGNVHWIHWHQMPGTFEAEDLYDAVNWLQQRYPEVVNRIMWNILNDAPGGLKAYQEAIAQQIAEEHGGNVHQFSTWMRDHFLQPDYVQNNLNDPDGIVDFPDCLDWGGPE